MKIPIQQKIQFVKDYEEFGIKYISEKYGLISTAKIRSDYDEYKNRIQTDSFASMAKVLKKIDSDQLLKLIQDFNDPNVTFIELCKKYKIQYSTSNITKRLRKVCDELGIEYRTGKVYIKYSKIERIEVVKYLLENGRKQTNIYVINKYNNIHSKGGISSFIRECIEVYNGEISESNRWNLSDGEKIQIIKYYEEFGTKCTMGKYKAFYSMKHLHDTISMWRKNFNLLAPIKTRTLKENIQLLKDYEQYGATYVMNKYEYQNINSVRKVICTIRKKVGIKSPYRTVEERMQIVKEYEQYGAIYVMNKYGYPSYEKAQLAACKYRLRLKGKSQLKIM